MAFIVLSEDECSTEATGPVWKGYGMEPVPAEKLHSAELNGNMRTIMITAIWQLFGSSVKWISAVILLIDPK